LPELRSSQQGVAGQAPSFSYGVHDKTLLIEFSQKPKFLKTLKPHLNEIF
jgi:hypothetical protein